MRFVLLLLIVALSSSAFAQQPSRAVDDEDLSVLNFLQAVETAIAKADSVKWVELLSSSADHDAAVEFFTNMVPDHSTRVVVKERDRSPLEGTLPGEGFRLIVEVFIESGERGRIATWKLDIRRPRGEDLGTQPW